MYCFIVWGFWLCLRSSKVLQDLRITGLEESHIQEAGHRAARFRLCSGPGHQNWPGERELGEGGRKRESSLVGRKK